MKYTLPHTTCTSVILTLLILSVVLNTVTTPSLFKMPPLRVWSSLHLLFFFTLPIPSQSPLPASFPFFPLFLNVEAPWMKFWAPLLISLSLGDLILFSLLKMC